MEQIKALLAVIFFFASLIFASPIFSPQANNSSTSKSINTNTQFVSDSMTINQPQYNFQPDAKFDLAKE